MQVFMLVFAEDEKIKRTVVVCVGLIPCFAAQPFNLLGLLRPSSGLGHNSPEPGKW